jgi:hypothetical protein
MREGASLDRNTPLVVEISKSIFEPEAPYDWQDLTARHVVTQHGEFVDAPFDRPACPIPFQDSFFRTKYPYKS